MKIFIVILNWNRVKDTIECLRSCEKLKRGKAKLSLVLVDNASTDESQKKLKKLKFGNGEYVYIQNKENLGYAGGNNVGIRYALNNKADYVIVLNNDTIVDKNLIYEFLKTARGYPKAGILTPKIYFAKGFEFHDDRYKKNELGKVLWYAGGKIDWDNVYGMNRGVDEVDKGQFDKEEEVDFATGTCMFMRSKALKQIGVFDEKYFMYLEDVDLCVRMRRVGWKVLYSPKGKLWHKVAQSSRIGSDLNDYYIHRNRLLFGMRYASVRTKFALLRESIRFVINGRKSQKQGVIDFYLAKFGKGS